MTTIVLLVLLAIAAILLAGSWLRTGDLKYQRHVAENRAAKAQAEITRLTRAVETAAARTTHAHDQRDAAVEQVTRLLVELRELQISLDQGAHKVAAQRLQRFINDREGR